MPSASVIIPAHNASDYLQRAVQSALDQQDCTVEVIVVDDKSDDNTFAIARSFSETDPRVRAIRSDQNIGPGFARNIALESATGDWVAVLDADDAFRPSRLRKLIALAQAHRADIVSDNLVVRPADGRHEEHLMFTSGWPDEPRAMSMRDFVHGNFGRSDATRVAYGMMKPVIRRTTLKSHNIRYEISRFAEDYIFSLRLLANRAKWILSPYAEYLYSERPNSMTMVSRQKDIRDFIDAEREVIASEAHRLDPETIKLLRQHLRTLELGHAWARFNDDVKARRFGSAAAVAAESPSTMAYILREMRRHTPAALGKLRAGQSRPKGRAN